MTHPQITPTTRAFFERAASGDLAYPKCGACQRWLTYPRANCPHCLADAIELQSVDGKGSVIAETTVRRAIVQAFADQVPYRHALIELDEGICITTMIVGAGDTPMTGQRVRAQIALPLAEPEADAAPLILFTPLSNPPARSNP